MNQLVRSVRRRYAKSHPKYLEDVVLNNRFFTILCGSIPGAKIAALLIFWGFQLNHAAVGQREIEVGPNVQVTKARENLIYNEVLLAADPANQNRLLGCTMAFSTEENRRSTMAYVSFDRGKNWDFGVENNRGIFSGDPACTYGADGSAYFTAIERIAQFTDRLVVYRSGDGGKSWPSPPQVLIGSSPSVDRPYVAVDQTAGSYRGRVYVYGQFSQRTVDGESVGAGIALWRSRDGGTNYEGPIIRLSNKSLSFHPANSVVLSDGTLVCLVAELDSQKRNDGFVGSQYRKADILNGTLKVLVSADGGESFAPAVKISEMYEDWRQESTGIPSLAADRLSAEFKDRLYAVWGDGRYGRTQILISSSGDKGKTWSKPQPVSDGQPTVGDGPDNFMPVVAVNPQGIVGVMWYDRRDNPDKLGYYVRFTASLDGGETWLPSVRVSEVPKSYGPQQVWTILGGAWHSGGLVSFNLRRYEWFAGGHTAGMAADANGDFHPFWVDNRTGLSQIWTASVSVKGAAIRNGSIDLAKLDDVSNSVSLELTKCGYQHENDVVSCEARLTNVSKSILTGPLILRVTALRSEMGEPLILNADNAESGIGALLSFQKAKVNSLAPNESSESRLLQFKIRNLRPFKQDDSYLKSLFVEIDARILGRANKN